MLQILVAAYVESSRRAKTIEHAPETRMGSRTAMKNQLTLDFSIDVSARTTTLAYYHAARSFDCDVNVGHPGFAQPDDKESWNGFDIDYCKAVAAAVFGDVTRASFCRPPRRASSRDWIFRYRYRRSMPRNH